MYKMARYKARGSDDITGVLRKVKGHRNNILQISMQLIGMIVTGGSRKKRKMHCHADRVRPVDYKSGEYCRQCYRHQSSDLNYK
jgi:hypothetical protein